MRSSAVTTATLSRRVFGGSQPRFRAFGRRAAGRAIAASQAFGVKEQSLLRSSARYFGLPITTIDKLSKFGGAIARAQNFKGLYDEIVSTFPDPAAVLTGARRRIEAAGAGAVAG